MSFVVSARKYRPQFFKEVVGQAHVTDTLVNLIDQDKLAHAFLFTGPRGVGKTTCARILAKSINCENFSDGKPCESCNSCTAFNGNASFNILELDAASNNSVENIRNLIEQVRFKPQKGQYKVFIIDEVHMLSQAAFNAFLKTLEEPPDYAIFILATTEKHKILPTILSRCQIYDFHRIEIEKIIGQLRDIAAKESITYDEDALYLIAEKADGALRDALSLFDRLASASSGNITYESTADNLFILDHSYYFDVCDAILREDASALVNVFDDVLKKGFQGNHFINGLAMHLRNLLLSKDQRTYDLVEVSDELRKRFVTQAHLFRSDDLMTAIAISNEVDINYQRAQNKRLHVEIGLLKICYIGKNKNVSVPTAEKKNLTLQAHNPPKPKTPAQYSAPKANPKEPKPADPDSNSAVDAPSKNKDKAEIVAKAAVVNSTSVDDLLNKIKKENESAASEKVIIKLEQVEELWKKMTEEQESSSLIATMRKAILDMEDETMVVKVPNAVAKEQIAQEKKLLQELRADLGNHKLEISILIEKDLFPDQEIYKKKITLSSKEKYDLLKKQNPLIEKFVKTFDLKAIDKF